LLLINNNVNKKVDGEIQRKMRMEVFVREGITNFYFVNTSASSARLRLNLPKRGFSRKALEL